MKAFQVTDFEKNPTIEDIQKPDPQSDQIRLKIMSCGLNFADILLMNGTYQEQKEAGVSLDMFHFSKVCPQSLIHMTLFLI